MNNLNVLNSEVDVNTILQLNGKEETEITSAKPSNLPCENLKRGNFGVKTDALSAVKLDPAVLEAQVTLNVDSDVSNESRKPSPKVQKEKPSLDMTFEESLFSMHKNDQLNLTSQQCALLMFFAQNLKSQPSLFQKNGKCAFCKSNGQSVMWYTSHILKDKKGRVKCPILRAFKCPLCGETGDRAHTPKYCPQYNCRS
ncbi:nanos homolog 1-like isoform X2 [Battus philenor]|uniref:nanos homolog 1-like isoform X2 n=1 Tax=Battus philenor TaxID=42288 RepID=UPI0035CFD6B3